MVGGGEPAGERIGVLEAGGGRDAEPQMLSDQRHRRNELYGIVHRNLRRLLNGVMRGALIDVVVADDIGDKYAVEYPALQYASDIRPVFEILILPGAISGMRPKSWRLVPDAIHVKSIEADLAGHRLRPGACSKETDMRQAPSPSRVSGQHRLRRALHTIELCSIVSQ